MMHYVFDVDGTLTPSRDKMDKEFANWFESFATHNAVYLVTGSNREKTLEQIPAQIYNLCMKVFQCSGNHVFEQDKEIYKDEWKISNEVNIFLLDKLHSSVFKGKTGYHFDHRPGLCNFSILGRNADKLQRSKYKNFDAAHKEREKITREFNKKFKDIRATVAGETGIDITPNDKGKGQILKYFNDKNTVMFFGDKTRFGGNDYDLAKALQFRNVFQVDDWKHTWKILQNIV